MPDSTQAENRSAMIREVCSGRSASSAIGRAISQRARLAVTSSLPRSGLASTATAPCVLPDGQIASLWLGRLGGPGLHQMKVMTPGGTAYALLLTAVDVEDIGCGSSG